MSEIVIGDVLQAENENVNVISIFENKLIESASGKTMEIHTSDGGKHIVSSNDQIHVKETP